MKVTCQPDASLIIHASPDEAALLAGREQFGDIKAVQADLQDKIADSWYAAGCPRER